MTHDEFDKLLQRRWALTAEVLAAKNAEYSARGDKLHNFKVAAALQGCTTAEALLGMLAKHLVSVCDMVRSRKPFDAAKWDEKIGDSINYLLLLEAVVKECGSAIPEA